MTCILVKQQIVVPSLSKKATWNKFLLLPRLILSNRAGKFFFFLHSSFQFNQRGFLPLLPCCKQAPFRNLAIAKNGAQKPTSLQMKLKGTSILFQYPRWKHWLLLLRAVSSSSKYVQILSFFCCSLNIKITSLNLQMRISSEGWNDDCRTVRRGAVSVARWSAALRLRAGRAALGPSHPGREFALDVQIVNNLLAFSLQHPWLACC